MRDIFGDELEIIGECPSCGAPHTRPIGTTHGPTVFHTPSCTRIGVAFGGHAETARVIAASKERDARQIEQYKKNDASDNPFTKR